MTPLVTIKRRAALVLEHSRDPRIRFQGEWFPDRDLDFHIGMARRSREFRLLYLVRCQPRRRNRT